MSMSGESVAAKHSPPPEHIETRLRQAELDLKLAEVDLRKVEFNTKTTWRAWLTSPVTPIVITAVTGFVITQITEQIRSESAIVLEREKLQSSLILKMIETSDPQLSATNLLFLLDAGLIQDPNGRIAALRGNPTGAPVLSATGGTIVPTSKSQIQQFFELYRKAFGAPDVKLVEALTTLFGFIANDENIPDLRYTAYVLAVIGHETAKTFTPITELGSDELAERMYGPDTRTGKLLGNSEKGDGARFKGRGYIQVVGRRNYAKLNELLNLADTENDLVRNPDAANIPRIAYQTASTVLIEGLLTGKKLSEYINTSKTDYIGARRVTNGLDKAEKIANDAKLFENILTLVLKDK